MIQQAVTSAGEQCRQVYKQCRQAYKQCRQTHTEATVPVEAVGFALRAPVIVDEGAQALADLHVRHTVRQSDSKVATVRQSNSQTVKQSNSQTVKQSIRHGKQTDIQQTDNIHTSGFVSPLIQTVSYFFRLSAWSLLLSSLVNLRQ